MGEGVIPTRPRRRRAAWHGDDREKRGKPLSLFQKVESMTEEQHRAWKALEAAFRKCKRAGLGFIGMDDMLYGFDRAALIAEERKGVAPHEVLQKMNADRVDTSNCYIDSGGW